MLIGAAQPIQIACAAHDDKRKSRRYENQSQELRMLERVEADQSVAVFKLLAVVVLYKMKPSESIAFSSLQATILCVEPGLTEVNILLYDNTPGGQDVGILPANVHFKSDPTNDGLAKAYNYALEMAREGGFDWLLTLDQDTSLSLDFLSRLRNTAMFVAPMDSVAAIVPCISSDGRVVSPFALTKHLELTKCIPSGFIGIPFEDVYAANSASTIKVRALQVIGGYDPRFYLDFSDLVMYRRLHARGLRVFVVGDIQVEHELAGLDLKNRSTPDRYENTYRAEEAAYDEYMGRVAGVVLTARILYRLIYKLWQINGSLSYFRIGLRFLCRRLFYSRNSRLESWEQFIKRRSAVQAAVGPGE